MVKLRNDWLASAGARATFALALGSSLAGCAADLNAEVVDGTPDSPDKYSFEAFIAGCDEHDDGWVCQGDMLIGRERDPYEFWSTFVREKSIEETSGLEATEGNVVGTRQALSRMGKQSDTNLTYCIRTSGSNSFSAAQASVVRSALRSAASQWQTYTSIRYEYVSRENGHCSGSNSRVDFHVRPMSSKEASDKYKKFSARAFFPGDSQSRRGILIRKTAIPSSQTRGFTGLMLHELGHTLGFTHEHYRKSTTGCKDGSASGSGLTRYDSQSIMHYASCNGVNFGGLSVYDKRGAQCSYLGKCEWVKLPGRALDIGVGGNGAAWIVGNNRAPYQYNAGKNSWTRRTGGNARNIAVGEFGDVWMVNTKNSIYRWSSSLNGGSWKKMPGKALDIAIGGRSDRVWIIGTNRKMYRWNGRDWTRKDAGGNGARIAVDNQGRPWIVNTNGNIYVENGNGWLKQPGLAADIGAGRDGSVWITGRNSVSGGHSIYQYAPSTGGTSIPAWTKVTGAGILIDAGGSRGTPWLVNSNGNIYRNRWE